MKNLLRLMLLIVAMMLLGFSARAGSITEEQAKAKAWSFLQTRHPMPSGKRLAPATMPRELHSTPTATQTLYVFNVGEQDGFVIVSGDDRARSILGYAESGSFDAVNMPTALREMLAIYTRQIEQLDVVGDASKRYGQELVGNASKRYDSDSVSYPARARRISGTMADVTPLLTTTWDQGAPYNNYCPTLNDQTALTGCVATAMAQIANYHKYPTAQVPSLAAYTSETNKINVSAWGATTFDWDNMLDSYDGSETNAQKAAVATLMRYCGQAAQMDYGFTSGAYNGDALYAFKEKLGYNANAEFRSAASYSANGWEDLIYKEVREGRPVYYSALDGDVGCDVSGHAFVIDGYQADGNYFHVNWGWGGLGDGYFNLFALDPSAPMSAPTATGWHHQMLAIIGLSPETVNTAKLVQDASGSWLITSADDWNELSRNLETYNGGSFKLTTDISVTTMVGTFDLPFSGTFDGQGHVMNVTIETGEWAAAPFRCVNGGSTIKNLKTEGTVTCSDRHASGLIGGTANLNNNLVITVTNCAVAVEVNGTEYAGGFFGHAWVMQPVFTDCVFSGSINGCHTHGSFVGWKEWESQSVYINCLSIPTSFEGDYTCDFSHPGMGEENASTLTNCYYNNACGFSFTQGISVSPDQLASGFVAHALQHGSRDWTTGQVWGQKIGTDAVPVLTSDASKVVYKVQFSLDGQVVKTVFTNGALGDKMPDGEDFGLANATFTSNGASFTSTTPVSSDLNVTVTGTAAFTLTLGTPAHGSISINNSTCMPGMLKKITAIPATGYKVTTVTVKDANNKALPVTQVSNNANEFVFTFPKSSVTVTATFTAGEAEASQFINEGMMLPAGEQPWTADTWTILSETYGGDLAYVGTPPVDALGHQWYEEGYALTNSDGDVLPNGNKVVWENHLSPFGQGGNYEYIEANGGWEDNACNFYFRRFFTFNNVTKPSKLYLWFRYDDGPSSFYLNGTLIYQNGSRDYIDTSIELTPEQMALIHTDGTPNVLAAWCTQIGGPYYIDCGLYDPTVFSYEVTGENTVRVLRNAFIMGDVVVPSTITASGKTYTVTELADDVFNNCYYGLTSVSLPSTLTSLGNNIFWDCNGLQYVKSYLPVYQNEWLIAAPAAVTEFELPMGYTHIWNNAFKFTDKLTTLTLPRSLTYIGYEAFVGCTALTDIYAYARPVPQTEANAFEGLTKSAITVHVFESALSSYKRSWGEEFNYVTIPDPQPITLTVNVTSAGSLRTLIENAATEANSTIYDVAGITVTGTINQDDLWTLSTMCTGVYSLATIDLSGVTIDGNYINNGMFRDRKKLTSIILPETLEYINDEAFYNCDGLTAIDIPASVKRIWAGAFAFCDNLVTVTGLEGLTDAWDVFWGSAITQPVYGGTVFLYMPPSITGEYEVPSGIKMTAAGSMRDSQLSALILPASLTDIGDDTFQGCPNLVDIYCYAITPPTCHSGVWEWDFNCGACTVHVPASALSDYQNADEWRDLGRIVAIPTGELVDLTINVATAGTLNDELFNAAVTNAEISDKVLIRNLTVTGSINAADVAYLNTLPNTLYNMELLDLSGTTLEGNAITERMFYATLYKAIKLPEGVTSIASEAFRTSRRLHEITLPDALESIGSYAFAGSGLTSITIPDGVTEIGDRGLQACSSLTTVTIGNGVTTIPDCWAEDCCNLEELTIGKNVTLIKWRSFCGSSLKNVYCYAKMPPSFGPDVPHSEINSEAVLHVYSNSLKRYQNANRWQDFTTILGDLGTYQTYDITVNVETMGTFSDALAAAMTTAGIEDLTDISKLTVTGNMNQADLDYLRDYVGTFLDKLDLGAVTVDGNTFGYQTLSWGGFEEVILPANLERMEGWSVLEDCHNLKSIVIPDNVTYLGPGTLGGATALESVTIGKRVNFFGWRTFCATNIKDIYCLAKNPPAWDNDIFADGEYPEVLHVYSNCLERYQNANGWKDIPTILGDLGTYPSIDLTVYVSTMGTFNEALAAAMTAAECEDMFDIGKLTVTGSIDNDDLYYLRDKLGASLDTLDLGAVTVYDNYLGDGALAGCGFEELILPANLESLGGWDILSGCYNIKTLNIPSSVRYIGPGILNGAGSLETITGGDGVSGMDEWNGMYFDNCPNLKSPVILGSIFFRLPLNTQGAYEVPDYVTTIARDGMWGVTGLTSLTLPESVTAIYCNVFSGNENLKDIYYYAEELPYTDEGENPFEGFDRPSCTLHVYEEMEDLFRNHNHWSDFNIVGDLGTIPNHTTMNEADYADLCTIFNTLDGNDWTTKWLIGNNVLTASRWRGVTFDEEGYVTSIDLNNNRLSGDISELSFTGLTKLNSLNLSNNALSGDIMAFKENLPSGCELYVEGQDLGYVGEHTLYELCNYGGLPSIAYYRSETGTLASTLIGVGGRCNFYHGATSGGNYYASIYSDGGTDSWNKFYWPSSTLMECTYPHRFTFTYSYAMGDANMDDDLNVLDLQTMLNYSNGHQWGLFNFYASDTYGQDDDINVQDIVTTVNILLTLENNNPSPARTFGPVVGKDLQSPTENEAYLSVENGQVVLYTTVPVAALDLRLAGIEPEALSWNTEAMGFATATMTQSNGTHAVIYSMQPREIEEGRTVLATFDAAIYEVSPYSVVLSDSKARSISVGNTVPTGISQTATLGSAARWSLTDLSGVVLATGTHAAETDILRMAKSQKLQGVFILNTDGKKRKIVIN